MLLWPDQVRSSGSCLVTYPRKKRRQIVPARTESSFQSCVLDRSPGRADCAATTSFAESRIEAIRRTFARAFRTERFFRPVPVAKIAITTLGLPRLSFITSGQGAFNFGNFEAASKRVYSSIYWDEIAGSIRDGGNCWTHFNPGACFRLHVRCAHSAGQDYVRIDGAE